MKINGAGAEGAPATTCVVGGLEGRGPPPAIHLRHAAADDRGAAEEEGEAADQRVAEKDGYVFPKLTLRGGTLLGATVRGSDRIRTPTPKRSCPQISSVVMR